MSNPDFDRVPNTIREINDSHNINVPLMYRWGRISHYYGDTVRQLLIGAAALMLLAAPFYTDDLATELPLIVIGTIALVCVAAITNPTKRGAISADAIASGVGLVIFEIWALIGYQNGSMVQFVIREALAIIFLFALYFSTKTLRAMFLGHVGGPTNSGVEVPPGNRFTTIQRDEINRAGREALNEHNDHQKVDFTD